MLISGKELNISFVDTLRSTQRLMDRIIALRKECIHGLGVPLLHKAYEVLDANQDDNALQVWQNLDSICLSMNSSTSYMGC